MAYQKFTEQSIAKLPVIIAGPILRRVDAYSVTVWMALKESRAVTLTVLDAETGQEALPSATACTAKIGKHLYLVCVTAQSTQHRLTRGKVYKYNLHFDGGQELKSNGIYSYSTDNTKALGLCYAHYDLPTFVILPEKWQDLHFLHGSCRKFHAWGLDALPAATPAIERSAKDPVLRPQFLLMTGDQIYADDVSDAVLHMLQEIGSVLLGRVDTLPGLRSPSTTLSPGRRGDVALHTLFLTCDTKKIAKSHLFHFYEFCAMYLLAWSDVLWPKTKDDFPSYKDVFGVNGTNAELSNYATETQCVIAFCNTLPEVRRVLANIPCYMILDDHEITDDWYISADWCDRVLGNDAGRRVIQNGLSAYAIFQAWGNTPEQFDKPGAPGHALLEALRESADADSLTNEELLAHHRQLDLLLNIPPKSNIFAPTPKGAVLYHPAVAPGGNRQWLKWNYTINAANYQIIVLDTRNWRSYPGPFQYSPPQLLSDEAWNMQLVQDSAPPGTTVDLTFLVSAAVPLAVPIIEFAQETTEATVKEEILTKDVEGWTAQARSFQLLLSKLATRNLGTPEQTARERQIVILSGDVHYSHAVRVEYWANRPYESEAVKARAIFALLTSSSLRNQGDKGDLRSSITLHDHGYEIFRTGNKRDWINYFGWRNEAKQEIAVGRYVTRFPPNNPHTGRWMLKGISPAVTCLERTRQQKQARYIQLDVQSEWRYSVHYLDSVQLKPRSQQEINTGGKQSRADGHEQHFQYVKVLGPGMQIVGRNTLGEITFKFEDGPTTIRRIGQKLWWREPETGAPSDRTFHIVSLECNDNDDPNLKLGDQIG